MLVVKGWSLLAHPLLLDQFERLTAAVGRERRTDPQGDRDSANAKVLTSLRQLLFEAIPDDPTRPAYRQGGTLSPGRAHWFRAKFGGGRFRLFFRYDARARIIVFAWVNDRDSLRTYGARTDAYAVFGRMLDRGHPSDEWGALLAEALDETAQGRLAAAHGHEEPGS